MMNDFNDDFEPEGVGQQFADMLFGVVGYLIIVGLVLIVNVAKPMWEAEPNPPAKQSVDLTAIMAYMNRLSNGAATLGQDLQNAMVDAATSKRDAENAKTRQSKTARELKQANEKIAESERKDASRQTRIMLVVDTSASMEGGVRKVRAVASGLCQTLPIAMEQVELGIIGYRGGDLQRLPLQPIRTARRDTGDSLRRVTNFVEQLKAVHGLECIDQAMGQAMQELDNGGSTEGAEVLALIADVSNGDMNAIDPSKNAALIAQVRQWVNRPDRNRRVIAIRTSGGPPSHRPFFEKLGGVSADSVFTEELSTLYPLVFEAAFAGMENNG